MSAKNKPGWIDLQHHAIFPEYVNAMKDMGISGGGGYPFPRWNTHDDLAMMDRHGIEAALLSVGSPRVFIHDIQTARQLARRCNEQLAETVRAHPHRFGALAIQYHASTQWWESKRVDFACNDRQIKQYSQGNSE